MYPWEMVKIKSLKTIYVCIYLILVTSQKTWISFKNKLTFGIIIIFCNLRVEPDFNPPFSCGYRLKIVLHQETRNNIQVHVLINFNFKQGIVD